MTSTLVSKLNLKIVFVLLFVFCLTWMLYPFYGYDTRTNGQKISLIRSKQIQHTTQEAIILNNSLVETTLRQEFVDEIEALAPEPDLVYEVPVQEGNELLSTFRLHYVEEVKNITEMVCSECADLSCNSSCSVFDGYIQNFGAKEESEDVRSPRLHLVPLDPMVWKMKESGVNSSEFNESVEKVARSFDSSPFYLRFKGSDHIFLCLTDEGCSEFARIFAERLSNNKGTRAILAGVNLDKDSIKWPCPLRIIDITNEETKSIDGLLIKLLEAGEKLMDKGNRWICADKTHPVNHWDVIEEGRYVGSHYVKEFNFSLCVSPKGGSTLFKMFMKRLMHRKDWNVSGVVHNPAKNGLSIISTRKNLNLTKKLFEDPDFIKGAIVRNPASRVISAYLDKMVTHSFYHVIPGMTTLVKKRKGESPTFAQFVELLTKQGRDPNVGDHHFRSQTSFCGLNTTKFDFVGDLDHLHEDFIEFAESIGVWEEYGASGWGPNGTEPMIDAWIYKQAPHRSTERIWQFYNERLLKKVYRYYKADFDLLGYSIDDLLATKPQNMTQPQNATQPKNMTTF